MLFGVALAISLMIIYLMFLASGLNPNYLNIALTAILVVITAVYARATEQILDENRKDRKIRH